MAHQPKDSLYLGLEGGAHKFTVESASSPGLWYTTAVTEDGYANCDCPGYRSYGHCGMVDGAANLLKLAMVQGLVAQLLDLSAGIRYNLQEDSHHELDAATFRRVGELEALADQVLSNKLG